jgi:hypothetical protein
VEGRRLIGGLDLVLRGVQNVQYTIRTGYHAMPRWARSLSRPSFSRVRPGGAIAGQARGAYSAEGTMTLK